MRKILKFTLFSVLSLLVLFLPKSSYAATFGLIAPTETLTRGQEVTFTVTVDTKGESFDTLRIGLKYDTQYLQFTNAIPGDTFSSIETEEIETGKIVLTGTNNTPFSGEGVFSYVKFKLIAEAPGSTQLCSFFNPEQSTSAATPTPTPTPTTPASQATPTPTSPPPTNLPKSGEDTITKKTLAAALVFFFLPLGAIAVVKLKSS